MTIMDEDKRHKLTFSQREGKAPLPEAMELETIPQIFRNKVWRLVHLYFMQYRDLLIEPNISEILKGYQFDILLRPHDEFTPFSEGNLSLFRHFVMAREYHEVITFVEYILRHSECTKDLYDSLLHVFDETPIAYFVKDIDGVPTVLPRINRETGEATRQAIETLRETNMDGAGTHLRQATEHLNARQYADSIVDSIHAVESVARKIDQKGSKTLGPALKTLPIHPALKEGFKKLYGYTNDEQGIRHALLDKGAPDVGRDEAVFMFGACASFAAYLATKHRDMQGGGDG